MIKFDEHATGRTKRTIQYVKEHENELQSRAITIRLTKHNNFISEASRDGDS